MMAVEQLLCGGQSNGWGGAMRTARREVQRDDGLAAFLRADTRIGTEQREGTISLGAHFAL
jgi:hypothetical protein